MPQVNKQFVHVVLDNSQAFLAALEELTKNAVFVGIPSTRVTRAVIGPFLHHVKNL